LTDNLNHDIFLHRNILPLVQCFIFEKIQGQQGGGSNMIEKASPIPPQRGRANQLIASLA